MADEFDRAVLFAAYRMAQVPGTERRNRVLARLHEPGDRPVFLPAPQGSTRPAARVLPLRVVLLAVAAGLLAVLGLSLLSSALAVRFDRAPVDQAVDAPESKDEVGSAVDREQHVSGPRLRDAPSVAAIVVPPPPVAAPVVLPPPPAGAEKATKRRAVAADEPALEPAREPTPQEIEEAIIADALAALDRSDWSAASAALSKHAKEFPQGKLELERNALKIVIRCNREHGDASRAQARDFIVGTALSPHWQRIIDACRATNPPVVDPFVDKRPEKTPEKTAER